MESKRTRKEGKQKKPIVPSAQADTRCYKDTPTEDIVALRRIFGYRTEEAIPLSLEVPPIAGLLENSSMQDMIFVRFTFDTFTHDEEETQTHHVRVGVHTLDTRSLWDVVNVNGSSTARRPENLIESYQFKVSDPWRPPTPGSNEPKTIPPEHLITALDTLFLNRSVVLVVENEKGIPDTLERLKSLEIMPSKLVYTIVIEPGLKSALVLHKRNGLGASPGTLASYYARLRVGGCDIPRGLTAMFYAALVDAEHGSQSCRQPIVYALRSLVQESRSCMARDETSSHTFRNHHKKRQEARLREHGIQAALELGRLDMSYTIPTQKGSEGDDRSESWHSRK